MVKFVVKKTTSGFKFYLKTDNGEIVATSEEYVSEQACFNGIESVKTNALCAGYEDHTMTTVQTTANPKFEMYKDRAGELRFRLNARNGEIIAVSKGYMAKASCLYGIESVRKNAPGAMVEKSY